MRIRNTTPDDPRRCEKCLSYVEHYRRCTVLDDREGFKPSGFGECIYGPTRQTARSKTCNKFTDREECINSIRAKNNV